MIRYSFCHSSHSLTLAFCALSQYLIGFNRDAIDGTAGVSGGGYLLVWQIRLLIFAAERRVNTIRKLFRCMSLATLKATSAHVDKCSSNPWICSENAVSGCAKWCKCLMRNVWLPR